MVIRIFKFNESQMSFEKITDEDISYVIQVFDEAIDMCQVRNLEPGKAWKLSNNQIFVGLDTYDIEIDDNRLLLGLMEFENDDDDTYLRNGIKISFVYDKNVFIEYRARYNAYGRSTESYATDDIGLLDFFEEVFTGIRRISDEKDWGVYYRIVDRQSVEVFLFKKK